MGTVRLIAKVPFLYASRTLTIGDTFDATEQDAKTLKHIGHAADAPARFIESKDLTSEVAPVEKVDRRTRAYRRRDLVAER